MSAIFTRRSEQVARNSQSRSAELAHLVVAPNCTLPRRTPAWNAPVTTAGRRPVADIEHRLRLLNQAQQMLTCVSTPRLTCRSKGLAVTPRRAHGKDREGVRGRPQETYPGSRGGAAQERAGAATGSWRTVEAAKESCVDREDDVALDDRRGPRHR